MEKWEYKVFTYGNKKFNFKDVGKKTATLEEELNQLGSEGWEIFSNTPIYSGSSGNAEGYVGVSYREFIFKRLIKE